ncbi:MAG: NUDIX domain-containing protein [Candidatus Levybacteria bacterium]|nr:NUDIX domain-containing protein [Candidatus Levybacteria bacterium]
MLIVKDNKVLLVRHGKAAMNLTGTYGLPAGGIEGGETEREAALRELFEETGLHADFEDLIEYPNSIYVGDLARKDGTT